MIKAGDTILIKQPTEKDPDRIIRAYVYNAWPEDEKGRRWLQTKGENGRKINLYEDSDKITGVLEKASEDG